MSEIQLTLLPSLLITLPKTYFRCDGWRYTLFVLTNQNHYYMPKLNDTSIHQIIITVIPQIMPYTCIYFFITNKNTCYKYDLNFTSCKFNSDPCRDETLWPNGLIHNVFIANKNTCYK